MTERRKKYRRYPPLDAFRVELPGDLARRITEVTHIIDPEIMPGTISMQLADDPNPEIQALVAEIDEVLKNLPIPDALRRFIS